MEGGRLLALDSGTGLTRREGRRFGLTVGAAFGVLAAIGLWRDHVILPGVLSALGLGLAIAGLVIPDRLGPVHARWMKVAHAISRVTTPLFLGIVYLAVLTPFGLVMRALGRNPLRHGRTNAGYWIERDLSRSSDLERQF